jgi:hypothetical protein
MSVAHWEATMKKCAVKPKITNIEYNELCDVVERAWQHWPIDPEPDELFNHTSNYARTAAMRILDILDIEPVMSQTPPPILRIAC